MSESNSQPIVSVDQVDAPRFVEVVVEATGRHEIVPAEWVGHPVLGRGISEVPTAQVAAADLEDRPTGRSTKAELEEYAERAGIDLSEASTNPARLAVIDAALDAQQVGSPPAEAENNPDVQLVAGDEDDQPIVPAARMSAVGNQDTGGTEPPAETPAAGDEEN